MRRVASIRRLGICAVVVAAVAVPVALQSSGAAAASHTAAAVNIAKAKAIVAQYSKPQPYKVPTLPRRPPTGKTVVMIDCTFPICVNNAFEPAAKALGWNYIDITFDVTKGPQAFSAAFDQALQAKPDYIVYVGFFPSTIVSAQLAQAKAAGIGVVSVVGLANDPAISSCLNCGPQLGADGRLLGALAVAYHAYPAVYVSDPTSVGTVQEWDCGGCAQHIGIAPEMKSLGAPIPAQLNDSGSASPAQNAATVVNYLESHPQVKSVISGLSDYLVALPAALQQAGLSKKVKYIVSAPDTADNGFIANGSETAAVVIEDQSSWWRAFSQAVALSVGVKPPLYPAGWMRIMTKSNVKSMLAASFPRGGFATPPGYQQAYFKAWHLK